MADKITICNAALLMIGGNEINSFEDETQEAKLCSVFYENQKNTLLFKSSWRFTLKQVTLAKLAATPLYGFKYGYQIPAEALRLRGVENNEIFKIFSDKIYSNQDGINMTIQYAPDESKFPAYFENVLRLELASLLALSLAEEKTTSTMFSEIARRELKTAKSIDSQNQTSNIMNPKSFWITVVR